MSQSRFQAHGPAQIYVSTAGTDNSPTYEFLGYSEGPVSPEFEGLYADEALDAAGMAPAEVAFGGEIATVATVLKYFNYTVYEKLKARVRGATPGSASSCQLGTLLHTEKKDFGLIIRGAFADCKAALYPELPKGYRFPFSYFAGPTSESFTWRATRVPCVFRCLPVINIQDGSFLLYDHDMTPITGITPS